MKTISAEHADASLTIVVECSRFDFMTNGLIQRGVIAESIRNPDLPLILDLSKIEGINSGGLSVLIALLQYFTKKNRRFVLTGINKMVQSCFASSSLDKLFEIYNDRASALQGLKTTASA